MNRVNNVSKYNGPPYSLYNFTWDPGLRRKHLIETLLSDGFPYSRRLKAHAFCINALRFSHGDGRFLVSGGEETRLWDMHQDDMATPCAALIGRRNQTFDLAFSAKNTYLYSIGADNKLLTYDMTHDLQTETSPVKSYTTYESDSVRLLPSILQLHMHPKPPVELHWLNQSPPLPRGSIFDHEWKEHITTERQRVQYHPQLENLFLTSDCNGEACLRDARMAFGPARTNFSHGSVVRTYATHLARSSVFSNPEISSLCFDRTGTKFCLTFLHYYPTIYSVSDPFPLAICSSPCPEDYQGYFNMCSGKCGSFGGPGLDEDLYYCGGSDDFRTYMWKIPTVQELAMNREIVSAEGWATSATPDAVAFTENDCTQRILPVNINSPHSQLTGHNSVVTNVVMHPQLPYVATCGIEKDLILHSPNSNASCTRDLELTPTTVREPEDYGDPFIYGLVLRMDVSMSREDRIISTFDFHIRHEGEIDVFQARPWPSGNEVPDSDSERDNSLEVERET